MKFQITRPQWLVELNIVIMLNIKNYKLLLSQIAVAGVILKTGVLYILLLYIISVATDVSDSRHQRCAPTRRRQSVSPPP